MSLIKLANKLTKLFNTLSSESQVNASKLLRPEVKFIKGIEKGNRRLLSALQKREKRSLNFINPIVDDHGSFNNHTFTMKVKKNPKTLEQAIIKRHEIWEAQHALGHKEIGRELRKIEKKVTFAPKLQKRIDDLYSRERKAYSYVAGKNKETSNLINKAYKIEDEISHDFIGSHTPEREKALYSRRDILLNRFYDHPKYKKYKKIKEKIQSKIDKLKSNIYTTNPNDRFYSHQNPQILINESRLLKMTPGTNSALKQLREYRYNSGEISDLKRKFNFNY